ncbi:MAG: ECF transporter S component [candidate division Zixibacteria bacterium]|nr:ECF transporter S component [candidate division Zixibacteria bacterium]
MRSLQGENMSSQSHGAISINRTTLTFWSTRSLAFQAMLIALAVILPAIAHLTNAPVRILLPMHWPVILAGLVYGWRGGALAGLLSPLVSYLVSGMPLPAILPAMTAELCVYGLITGLMRETLKLNRFLSVAFALIIGRIVFVFFVFLGSAVEHSYGQYFGEALIPGIAAGTGQIILLPLISAWWINKSRNN